MTPGQFIEELSGLRFANTFNPYSSRCDRHDVYDAPKLRSRMLLEILGAAAARGVDSIWVGRDLGYRGGRRTGLAFTDDVHVYDHAHRWGISGYRPTIGAPYAERTATFIWRVLSRIERRVFLWNVFPLHPYEPGNHFSNRLHNSGERQAGKRLLRQLVDLLEPRRLIAIGNDAARVVFSLPTQCEVEYVRHPSYGGQTLFISKMCKLYDLDADFVGPDYTPQLNGFSRPQNKKISDPMMATPDEMRHG